MPHEPLVIKTTKRIDTATTKEDFSNTIRQIMPLKDFYPDLVEFTKIKSIEIAKLFKAKHYFRLDLKVEDKTKQVYFIEANLTPNFSI